MSRSRRRLTVLACVASVCALSASAASAAQTQQGAPDDGHGVVLSPARHGLRLVDRAHQVADVRVASAHGLSAGDRVTVSGGRARVTGHVRKLAFLARVARSTPRATTLTLGDGSSFKLVAQRRARHGVRAAAAAATTAGVDVHGLTVGQTLLVTIAPGERGDVVLSIKVLSSPTGSGPGSGDGAGGNAVELHASGVVTDDEGGGSFGITPSGADELELNDPQGLYEAAGAAWCDVVELAYHEDDGDLVADQLRVTGHSHDGDCADDGSGGDEVDGTVTALAPDASSLTLAPDDDSPAVTIPVDDASLLDGIDVGDDVEVTLDDGGTATDVELLDSGDEDG